MIRRLWEHEPPLDEAVRELVVIYGEFLTGRGDGERGAELRARIAELMRTHFSSLWPVRDLVDSVLCQDKFLIPAWQYEGELRPEMSARGAPLPPLLEVEDAIRDVLRERALNREIDD